MTGSFSHHLLLFAVLVWLIFLRIHCEVLKYHTFCEVLKYHTSAFTIKGKSILSEYGKRPREDQKGNTYRETAWALNEVIFIHKETSQDTAIVKIVCIFFNLSW